MKSKKILKSALMIGTFLCSASALYADQAVVVTEQKDTTKTHQSTDPIPTVAKGVSDVVKKGVDAVKDGAEAVTTTITDATTTKKETAAPIVVKTDANAGNVVIRHHHSRGYLNGYKGYRHPRPHYARYMDGWYYPEAAFKDEVKSDVVVKEHASSLPAKHIHYCQTHYKSYRLSDNSFQPYHGPRQQCYSHFYHGNK